MDRKESQLQEIQRLIRVSARARQILGGEVSSLKERLDVPKRMKTSLRRNPFGWIGGSLAAGFLASVVLKRRSPKQESTASAVAKPAVPLTILGLALTALRPLAKDWIAAQASKYVQRRLAGVPLRRTASPTPNPTPVNPHHV